MGHPNLTYIFDDDDEAWHECTQIAGSGRTNPNPTDMHSIHQNPDNTLHRMMDQNHHCRQSPHN